MAIDEVLLEAAADLGAPLLRFYSWSELAASFGYSQRYAEIVKLTPLRPLVRRPTGGGLVAHEADWTYSLVFSPTVPWYSLKAIESYQRVHAWIQAVFERLSISTQLAVSARTELPGQCFAGAERFDLLCDERKIAGAAQRRNHQGLLIQGSVQPPTGVPRASWEATFCEVAQIAWGVMWKEFSIPSEMQRRIEDRAREKFGNPEFTRSR